MTNRSFLVLTVVLCSQPALADFESPPTGQVPTRDFDSFRRWDFSTRTSLGRNDNVPLVPDRTTFPPDGHRGANYAALQGDGVLRLLQSPSVVAGATLSFSGLWYESKRETPASMFDDYDFDTLSPGVFATYRFLLNGRPAALTTSYVYSKEDGFDEDNAALGLESQTLRVTGAVQLRSDLQLTASLSRGWDNFEVEFPDPALDDRDADRSSVDFNLRYLISGGLHTVSIGMGYSENDSKGRNFEYSGYDLHVRIESGLLRPVWIATDIKYRDLDYRGFISGFIPPPGRNNQKVTTTGVQLVWPFARHWTADLFYTHDQFDANEAEFEAEANVSGMGVSYRF